MHTILSGKIGTPSKHCGCKAFDRRIKAYPSVFENATGVDLFPGTINVVISHPIKIVPSFRIVGKDIGEPDQDLLFEECLFEGEPAFRIRPFNLKTGKGGWGDHILEISSKTQFADLYPGKAVSVTFFRSIDLAL